jgi:alpha-1,3-rhamnosyltransferase
MSACSTPTSEGVRVTGSPIPAVQTNEEAQGVKGALGRVGVLVPSYNHARFVERCLRSIFAQTYPPTKLLVIDDGSTDGSPQVIERVLQDCPFPAELIVRPNRGLCATLNEGFGRLEGEYFAYLASDDVWHPERLAEGVAALARRPEAVLSYSHCYIIDAQDRIIGDSREWGWYFDGDHLETLLRVHHVPENATVTFRREAVARFGWNEANRLEDYELYLQLATLGPFAFVPCHLGYHRLHSTNTTWQMAKMMDEVLNTQARLAGQLGLSDRELQRYQAHLRFQFGEHQLIAGKRWMAIQLTMCNLHGAPSWSALARRLALLAFPQRVVRWIQRCRRATRAKRYGVVGMDGTPQQSNLSSLDLSTRGG